MGTTTSVSDIEALGAMVSDLTGTDVSLRDDQRVRDDLLALIGIANQINAAIWSHAAVFDARGLSVLDGYKTTKGWLKAHARVMPAAAANIMDRANLLRELPALAQACARGEACADQVARVVKLAKAVGIPTVREHDESLATLAATTTATEVDQACVRIRAHADPDGPEPKPGADWQERDLLVARRGQHVVIRGQLDLETGAALLTALDALMRPPAPDDDRTPGQRRADALAELVLGVLNHGCLPTVKGRRPHLGVLITPTALQRTPTGPRTHEEKVAAFLRQIGDRLHRDHHPNCGDHTNHDHHPNDANPNHHPNDTDHQPPPATRDPITAAGFPALPEGGWMDWVGEIPVETAQRIACDADVWRALLDPATSLPIDVGRAHRTAPEWMLRALHARDRGCRWPGCDSPTPWTDAHHLRMWIHGGHTAIPTMILLCRSHHVMVHEGKWRITLTEHTGEVTITRPDGTPYELGRTQPWTGPTTRRSQ